MSTSSAGQPLLIRDKPCIASLGEKEISERLKPNITIVCNTTFFVVSARMGLIRRLQCNGYNVIAISPRDKYVVMLIEEGVTHEHISMSQYGMNPLHEVSTALGLARLFKKYKPVASLHFTIKPNIFGSIAAYAMGVPTVCNIAGAGQLFSGERPLLEYAVGVLYGIALRRVHCVFFQNNDDMGLFLSRRMLAPHLARRIPGSGVDLALFRPTAMPTGDVRFLFVGRLLKEKGIEEFVGAAKRVNSLRNRCRFVVVGQHVKGSRGIGSPAFEYIQSAPSFTYRGTIVPTEMPAVFRDCSCVVLPSYYCEGVPRSLLEAGASARAIITTGNVGCRDVVDDKVNGYRVPVRDMNALAHAMIAFADLPHREKQKMGENGRLKVEQHFDERIVLDAYVQEIDRMDKRLQKLPE